MLKLFLGTAKDLIQNARVEILKSLDCEDIQVGDKGSLCADVLDPFLGEAQDLRVGSVR